MGKRVLNALEMKKENRRKVLENLRSHPCSRAELSRKIGLTRAAISVIVDELLSDDMLAEGEPVAGKVGRTTKELRFNPDRYYIIGIDIARDYCSVGIGDFLGRVQKTEIIRLDGDRSGADEILAEMTRWIDELMQYGKGRLLGIGITAPGPLDVRGGKILNPPNFKQWENREICWYFEERYQCPVFLENNAKALTLAERYYGVGRAFENYIELVVDTGIGGGIILNGRLYRGSFLLGSDFGHMSVDINGEKCSCGNYGCIEMYASIPRILAFAEKYTGKELTWEQLVDGANAGDTRMQEVIDREIRYLSVLITNIVNIIDTEAVVLASTINYKSEYIFPKIQEAVNRQFIGRKLRGIEILPSGLDRMTRILPCINFVIENMLPLYFGEDDQTE